MTLTLTLWESRPSNHLLQPINSVFLRTSLDRAIANGGSVCLSVYHYHIRESQLNGSRYQNEFV